MNKFGETEWFLKLPHEIAGAIAISDRDSPVGNYLEFLFPVLILSTFVLALTLQPAERSWNMVTATILILVGIYLANCIAHLSVLLVAYLIGAPHKGAIYAWIEDLSERDLLIALKRRVVLEKQTSPKRAHKFLQSQFKRKIVKFGLRTLLAGLVFTAIVMVFS